MTMEVQMSQVIELQSYNYVPIQQSLNRNVVLNKMVGTHFFGSFENVSFEELVELFGILRWVTCNNLRLQTKEKYLD